MSGPKVLRVVTQEEQAAQGRALLRKVDATIAQWNQACERSGQKDAAASQDVAQRRSALERMLAEGRFREFHQQADLDQDFLRRDADARLEKAAAAAERALRRQRKIAAAAAKLLKRLESSGRSIPEKLRRGLQSPEHQEQAMAQALALLSPTDNPTGKPSGQPAKQQQALSLSDWLAQNPEHAASPTELNIERLLAELTALGADVTAWSARHAALIEAAPEQQTQRAGSLLLDLSQAVKEARAKLAQGVALAHAAAALGGDTSQAAGALAGRIQAAIATGGAPDAQALVAEAAALAATRQHTLAADARRRVMLEGLSRLGYQVHEGMATAWVQGGKVVVRNAEHPGYAVELAGGASSDRFGVRVVACPEAGALRDATRDVDVETLWCAELEQLRRCVARAGGWIEIEHAQAPGAEAVTVIEHTVHEAAEATHTRSLER